MSELFQSEMIINSLQFEGLMKEEDMKNYFKEKLAFQLAHQLIETNRATFSYTRLPDQDSVSLKGEVRL
jgi:hypothetical protein